MLRANRFTVRGFIAVDAQRMQLVEHDLRRDCGKGIVLEQIDERGLLGLRQPKVAIDVLGHVLGEQTQLHQCAGRVRMSIRLGEAAEGGEFGPAITDYLEVDRLHAIASASAASKSARLATTTGISCGLSSLSATSIRIRFWK